MAAPSSNPMRAWTNGEVCAWVRSLPHPAMARVVAPLLEEQDVDGAALVEMTDYRAVRDQLGIKIGHARALVREILNKQPPPPEQHGEPSFTLCIQMSNGRTVRLPDVRPGYTIAQVKAIFRERQGPARTLELRSILKGTCDDCDTLRSHAVTPSNNLLFQVLKQHGGGFPGPDLTSRQVRSAWSSSAPKWRMHIAGLNVEFKHQGKHVIGNFGFGDKVEIAKKRFYSRAVCPHFGVAPPNYAAVTRLYFSNCKVFFDGELEDGTEVKQYKQFGDEASHFDGRTQYSTLELTITRR